MMADDGLPRPRPENAMALFRAFTVLALQGFGGVLAVAQRELVEKRGWLSKAEFIELLAISQVLPGPNVVNISLMIGDRFFGLRGAAAALAGMFALPCVIVLSLAAVSEQLLAHPAMAGALRGMGAVAAGLILATGLKLLGSLRGNVMGRLLCLLLGTATIIAVAVLRWPLIWVVLGLGSMGMAMAWWRLRELR